MNNFVIFTLGAAAGSIITWKLLKTKYEQIAQDEIDSVKEVYFKKNLERDKEPKDEYEEITKRYSTFSDKKENKDEEGEKIMRPYVICPEEFGEMDEYETESLTYYADGVLTDDFDNEIEDVDDLVGEESLSTFGDYEDDSVFVRNDKYKTDYEILLDDRKFSEIIRK